MCPSQLLILNFLSRLIRIFGREWRRRGRRRGGDGGRAAPLVAGGGDLAKLKSLLYGRIGRGGVDIPGGFRRDFAKRPASVQIVSRLPPRLFFYPPLPLPASFGRARAFGARVWRSPRLDRANFWIGFSRPAIYEAFPNGKHATLSAAESPRGLSPRLLIALAPRPVDWSQLRDSLIHYHLERA